MMENTFTDKQIGMILQKLISKVRHELELAVDNGTVGELMDEYGITLEESAMPVNPRLSKILVVGELVGKRKDYIQSAKKLNIPEYNIEFESDYEKLHNLNLSRLEYSDTYSDVIFGQVPHSMAGKGDSSSMIAKMEKEADKYPRVIRATTENELKLTISSFRKALKATRYFESTAY